MASHALLFVLAIIWATANAQTPQCQLRKMNGERVLDGSCSAGEYLKITRRCNNPYPWAPRGQMAQQFVFYFDETTCKCKKVKVTGYCDQGYHTLNRCKEKCECDLPVHIGHTNDINCKPQQRWAFDGERCVPFLYQGCGGNVNNYMNFTACNGLCNPVDMGSNDYFHMMGMMQRMQFNNFGQNRASRWGPPPPPPRQRNNFGSSPPPPNMFQPPPQRRRPMRRNKWRQNNFRRQQAWQPPYNVRPRFPQRRW